MTKRFASLALVLMLCGSALAGVPMHSGGGEAGMMACCKKALAQNDSPRVAAARLCCAMNCDEPAPTNGNPGQRFSQSALEPSQLVVIALPPAMKYRSPRGSYAESIFPSSNPSYILNLALLI